MINISKIVACGCSFTYDLEINKDKLVSYPTIIGKKLNTEIINLSKPGASNYSIAKQIEYSLQFDPDLIIIGLTTTNRIEWKIDKNFKFDNYPTYESWMHPMDKFTLQYNKKLSPNYGKLSSNSIIYFNNKDDEKIFKNFFNFIINYNDIFIQKDKDYFIILGICSLLEKNNIKYLIIDFDENKIQDSIKISWKFLKEKFPWVDGLHFNQSGHEYIANIVIENLLKKFKNT